VVLEAAQVGFNLGALLDLNLDRLPLVVRKQNVHWEHGGHLELVRLNRVKHVPSFLAAVIALLNLISEHLLLQQRLSVHPPVFLLSFLFFLLLLHLLLSARRYLFHFSFHFSHLSRLLFFVLLLLIVFLSL
jgi:hypothetical protein